MDDRKSYDDLWWFANPMDPLATLVAPEDAELGPWTAVGNENDASTPGR